MGLSPPLDDLVSQLPGPLEAGGVEHGADVLRKCLLMLPADLPEGVASDVHLATLPGYALEVPLDGVDQAAVIVAGDQPHATRSAVLEAPEKPVVRRLALRVGHLDSQQLAGTVVTHALHDQHALTHHLTTLAHVLIASVDDEVRVGGVQRPLPPRRQVPVKEADEAADGALAEARAAQHLGDVPDLPGAHTLEVHLHQRPNERLLAALVPLEQLTLERPLTIHRHRQRQRADARLELPTPVPVAVASAPLGAFIRAGLQVLGDLRIQESIQHRLDQITQEARVIDQRLTRNHRQSHILQMSHRPLRSQWVTAVSHLGGAMAPSLPAAAQGPGRTRFTEGTGRNPWSAPGSSSRRSASSRPPASSMRALTPPLGPRRPTRSSSLTSSAPSCR